MQVLYCAKWRVNATQYYCKVNGIYVYECTYVCIQYYMPCNSKKRPYFARFPKEPDVVKIIAGYRMIWSIILVCEVTVLKFPGSVWYFYFSARWVNLLLFLGSPSPQDRYKHREVEILNSSDTVSHVLHCIIYPVLMNKNPNVIAVNVRLKSLAL